VILAACSCNLFTPHLFGADQGEGNREAAPAEQKAGYPPPPEPHRGRSPFADIKPEDVPSALGMSGLICDWFNYPLTKGGENFRPVYLPFDYSATVPDPDPNESYTFPQLLSLKADWIDDNICREHPFFVFQRERDRLADLCKPGTALLATFIKAWEATHAVGGTLSESPKGWSGSLVVYDRQGAQVFARNYDEPRDYFQLMADMTVDLFAFRKCPLSVELRAELGRKCTSNKEALRAFGEAATVGPWSNEGWACYEKALVLDPDFAEARFWYGNQKGWTAGNDKWGSQMRAQALKSHLVFRAGIETDGIKLLDKETAGGIVEACQKMLKLAPENPTLLLIVAKIGGPLESRPEEELARLEDVARKHPGFGGMLAALAEAYFRKGIPEKAIPMALSETASGYFWPRGEHCISWNTAGLSFEFCCADWKRSFTCAARAVGDAADSRKDLSANLTLAAADLRELCRFRQASRMYQRAYEVEANPWRLIGWIESLYEGGFPDEAIAIQEKYKAAIEKSTRLTYMTAAAQDIYYGKDINQGIWRVVNNAPKESDGVVPDDELLERIGAYLSALEGWHHGTCLAAWLHPWDRQLAILADLWERRERTELSDYLYETYTWLHPDDAYFAGARDEFMRERTGPDPQLDTAHVLEILNAAARLKDGWDYVGKNLEPMLVEWHIKRLLDARDFRTAEQVAAAYETLARSWSRNTYFQGWTRVLHRRVVIAAQQAGSAAAGTSATPESLAGKPNM
jgi:hypothetical protein